VKAHPILAVWLGAALLLAMAGYSASSFELSTGLSQFLGADSDIDLVRISADLADSSLTRTLILSVGGPDGTTRAQAAREWSEVLSAHPEVASIRSGPDEGLAPSASCFSRRIRRANCQTSLVTPGCETRLEH
jgi:predicted exporter